MSLFRDCGKTGDDTSHKRCLQAPVILCYHSCWFTSYFRPDYINFQVINTWKTEGSVEVQFLFFFDVLIFNWRITALPYWVGFCHSSTWISHRYTYVLCLLNLPPIPSHPSRLSQSTCLNCHTAYSHRLFCIRCICFHATLSIHPALSFPSVSTSLFCLHLHCISTAALQTGFISTIFLDSIHTC